MIEELSNPLIQQFIQEHENDDPYQISLKAKELEGVSSKLLAEQIEARKKAKRKLPEWYAKEGIVYPSPSSVEQSSSEMTAKFKSSILTGKHIIDLTGGMGVDTAGFATSTETLDYVEKDNWITQCAEHNLKIFGHTNVRFHQTDAASFLENMEDRVDGIFMDPLRRPGNKRVFLFEDCEPDITSLQDLLLEKASQVLIKASPMVDITYGLKALNNVIRVYVVAVKNEVKEVLFLMGDRGIGEPGIEAVNISSSGQESFGFKQKNETVAKVELSKPLMYLYEPNAAILKAGAFNTFGNRYHLKKLHKHSHLYTSTELNTGIPGRKFIIRKTESLRGGRQLKQLSRANIATRNFKISVETIKKRFNISDGGLDYLFFTTDMNEDSIILYTEKLS